MFNVKYLFVFACLYQIAEIKTEIKMGDGYNAYPYVILIRSRNPNGNLQHISKYFVPAHKIKNVDTIINECLNNRSQDWDAEVVLFKNNQTQVQYEKSSAILSSSKELKLLIAGLPQRPINIVEFTN